MIQSIPDTLDCKSTKRHKNPEVQTWMKCKLPMLRANPIKSNCIVVRHYNIGSNSSLDVQLKIKPVSLRVTGSEM